MLFIRTKHDMQIFRVFQSSSVCVCKRRRGILTGKVLGEFNAASMPADRTQANQGVEKVYQFWCHSCQNNSRKHCQEWLAGKTVRDQASHSRKHQTARSLGVHWWHTLSIAFRHLPPNSARFSYATEGALFISAQLTTDTTSAPQKVWVLIWL